MPFEVFHCVAPHAGCRCPSLPFFAPCSDEHALLKHQKGDADGELEAAREQLAKTQDALAAAEVWAAC